ncbi:uncharacterized protein LOC128675352 [Plodia interpunctella]|uniref:uncharacterized protein LOC128675352 n=1 Tax=Plodia interpunctella TaxID=58824 RepID=UPI0023677700|nr:uncharacterized protein LOC128675352 [Plodia interpunctella]
MSRCAEKWLLVQWDDSGVDVVHVRSLTNTRHEDIQPGAPMSAFLKGEPKAGTFICKSHDRHLLEQMQLKMKDEAKGGPSGEGGQGEEPGDFSDSASSWEPSDDHASESDEMEEKKVKLDHFRKQSIQEKPRKRILTPSHRANAVIPEIMQRGKHSTKKPANRKRTYGSTKPINDDKLPDSTKKNMAREIILQNVTIDLNDIMEIRECFRDLFQMVKDMSLGQVPCVGNAPVKPDLSNTLTNLPCATDDEKENDRSRSAESDRSEDNILISNKYKNYNGNDSNNTSNKKSPTPNIPEGEWIAIGSGKTLLHKDKFRKVNWKSYTIATRTLLLALFPRRILATHSLTGKKSPAFRNKPAKMCLDPKIISDVIIEIQDRFNVKENLIRSIITTKCADECKMYKMRQDRRKTVTLMRKQEIVNDETEEDRNNRTA